MAELVRLDLLGDQPDFQLFPALAEAERVPAADFPREKSPRTYLALGTSILYARSSWSPRAIWFVTPCSGTIDVDHTHPNAGSFVLSRGSDELIVDPCPIWNTVQSHEQRADSHVGQLSRRLSTQSGVLGTQDRVSLDQNAGERIDRNSMRLRRSIPHPGNPERHPLAYRDLVLIPYRDGEQEESALLFVLDRSKGRTAAQSLNLRFRSPAKLATGC